MTSGRITDLERVECEHGLTQAGKPFVKIRALHTGGSAFGEVDPADARHLATDLMNVAARAEYEHDLWAGSLAKGIGTEAIAVVLHIVREGEERRMMAAPSPNPGPASIEDLLGAPEWAGLRAMMREAGFHR